ncbi:unnamed protein product [Aphanomyces euteiches]|nr:hypothetical protein Ae201684P_019975 [Aphanomyces euteiches]KAH9140703.1 hypothetical protein AeRB84_015079 [Aphanomyces euteiches]
MLVRCIGSPVLRRFPGRLPVAHGKEAKRMGSSNSFIPESSGQPPLETPSKIVDIANDQAYVTLTRQSIWTNPAIPTYRSRPAKDFFFSRLLANGQYEALQLFGHESKLNTVAWVHFGDELCSGQGIVHGGCLSTVFDEMLGATLIWATERAAVTASLTVNFRRSFPAGRSALFYTDVDKIDGRKVYLKARLEDNNGVVYADSSALFVSPKPKAKVDN